MKTYSPTTLFCQKIQMTNVFLTNNQYLPVTVCRYFDHHVLQKTKQGETKLTRYQVGFLPWTKKHCPKLLKQQFTTNIAPQRRLRELHSETDFSVGAILPLDMFQAGMYIDAQAVSKGKGFSGSIKRFNYSKGPAAHGSGYHRGVGSMGSIHPHRIFKSKKMPGRMGGMNVTVKNLAIVSVNVEKKYLLIAGSVPGAKNQFIRISSTGQQMKTPPVLFKQVLTVETEKATT